MDKEPNQRRGSPEGLEFQSHRICWNCSTDWCDNHWCGLIFGEVRKTPSRCPQHRNTSLPWPGASILQGVPGETDGLVTLYPGPLCGAKHQWHHRRVSLPQVQAPWEIPAQFTPCSHESCSQYAGRVDGWWLSRWATPNGIHMITVTWRWRTTPLY